jgi:uncharacterized membrane protein YagU involved in acid resistance
MELIVVEQLRSFVRWLSDRTVMPRAASVAAWNTPTLFLQPLGWAKISLFQAVSAFIKPLAPMIFITRFKL